MKNLCDNNKKNVSLELIKELNQSQQESKIFFLRTSNSFTNFSIINFKRGFIIGEGLNGKVYECLDQNSGEIYATKTIVS